jgi:peptidyl-prolyl cis-trans isomerase SurA
VRKPVFILIQCMALFCFSFYVQADNSVVDRIVAVVNGEIITLSDIGKYKKLLYMGTPEAAGNAQADRNLLEQMVDKKIIQNEAKSLEITISSKDLNDALEDILARNNVNQKQLQEYLTSVGSSIEEYKGLLEGELLQTQVIGRKVQAKINITDQDAEAHYEKYLKPKEKPGERIRIMQILLLNPQENTPESIAGIEKSIAEIREKIVAGESFGRMAVTYSQGPSAQSGGDLGYFHRGELLPEIEGASFAMENGDLSPIIRTSVGFHLIKLLDKDLSEEDRSWKDHENEIKNTLYNQLFEKQYSEWMETLKTKSYIKIVF